MITDVYTDLRVPIELQLLHRSQQGNVPLLPGELQGPHGSTRGHLIALEPLGRAVLTRLLGC